jgi:hypothetical protein
MKLKHCSLSKTRILLFLGIILCRALSCYSQDKDVDPNALVPALGNKAHEVIVKLVGASYEMRTISKLTSFLPLKIHKVQVRGPGVVLFDADGHAFPVLRMVPPDLRKIAPMNTLREALSLLTGSEDELNANRIFVCENNLVEAALESLKVGEGLNIAINVAYAANDRITCVSSICMYKVVKKGGGLDTPFFENSVSTWMSPRFPLDTAK